MRKVSKRKNEDVTGSERLIVIEQGRIEKNYWSDLWSYRELFAILAWRDVAVPYKQTVIGVAWAILRPVATAIVFTIVFGKVAKMPTEGTTPYPILVMAGMLPWFLMSSMLTQCSNSIINNANLIGKIYFPRIIIPLASSALPVVDFLISLPILFLVMTYYQFYPNLQILFLPFFMVLAYFSAIGLSLMLSALTVRYRDIRYIIPFLVQLGVYVTPVGFSSTLIPDGWRAVSGLNPAVGVIDGFRWSLLGGQAAFYWPSLVLSFIVTVSLLILGVKIFRATESKFADVI
jgi:lipopolysaccharide transport system permease protein